MTGDPRFHQLLKEIGELHDKKQEDYGSDSDPFANVRSSEDWGIEPWVGALVRLNDKVHRLQQFARKGELANESAEDSMFDIAVYALIALILYREETGERTIRLFHPAQEKALREDLVDTAIPNATAKLMEMDDEEFLGVLYRALGRVQKVGTSTDTVEHDPDDAIRFHYE